MNQPASTTLHALEDVLRSRIEADPEESYTARLLADPELIQRKIMEEAFEFCLELARSDRDLADATSEAADLLYHLMVGLVCAGLSIEDVLSVLEARRT